MIIPGYVGVQATIHMSVCVSDTMVSACMSRCVCVCVCVVTKSQRAQGTEGAIHCTQVQWAVGVVKSVQKKKSVSGHF